jgi:hypothetical protein
MTIKIIKAGKVEIPVFKHTCDNCGTEFEYDKRDVRETDEYLGVFVSRKCGTHIYCPLLECGKQIILTGVASKIHPSWNGLPSGIALLNSETAR